MIFIRLLRLLRLRNSEIHSFLALSSLACLLAVFSLEEKEEECLGKKQQRRKEVAPGSFIELHRVALLLWYFFQVQYYLKNYFVKDVLAGQSRYTLDRKLFRKT